MMFLGCVNLCALLRFGAAIVITLSQISATSANEPRMARVVVIDNSGLVRYTAEANENGLTPYGITTRLFVSEYLSALGDDTHLFVHSVVRPGVVWEGPAKRVGNRNNHTMVEFVTERPGGCADFEAVLKSVNRTVRSLELPLVEVMFLSPLVHTGSHPCELDRDNLAPPKTFFEGLAKLHEDTGAVFNFFWVFEDVMDALDNHLFENGIPFRARNARETRAFLQ